MAYRKIKKDGTKAKETNPVNKAKRTDAKVKLDDFIRITNEYIKVCEVNDDPPMIGELALLLGISRETLNNYRKKSVYRDVLKRIDEISENYWVKRGNKSNKPLFSMFMLKSKHGYVEAQYQKVDLNVHGNLGVVEMPKKKPKISGN